MSGRTVLPGTFDGVHLGHRFLIEKAKQLAGDTKITILTFTPHPAFVFEGIKGDFLLTTQEEKETLLRSAGVEEIVTLSFDDALRNMSPEDFWREVLLAKLDARKIIVGEDFRFGRNREGDVKKLSQLGSLYGVEVLVFPHFMVGGRVVKSERIRKLVKEGKVSEARELLGRLYSLKGKVIKGQGLGRNLGCPTANLEIPPEKLRPMKGVYAVKVRVGEKSFDGICYIGDRPTISPLGETICEVHIFDEDSEFLGEAMEVLFVEFLREERRFSSLEELSRQIEKDIAEARKVLSTADVC